MKLFSFTRAITINPFFLHSLSVYIYVTFFLGICEDFQTTTEQHHMVLLPTILSSQVVSLPCKSVIQDVANFCAVMDTLIDQDGSQLTWIECNRLTFKIIKADKANYLISLHLHHATSRVQNVIMLCAKDTALYTKHYYRSRHKTATASGT